MKGEILAILDLMEQEKGLAKETLIGIVEDAVLAAAKKKFGESKKISVSFEENTGEIKINIGKKEIFLEDLGRIAVQNAKQVIFKEIKQLMGEKVYAAYSSQIGTILTGRVEALDGENFIIEVSDAEGLLPRRECLPQDNFRIGNTVKAYLFDIKTGKVFAPLLLSRTHPNFLKRLFEIEIPEVSEGIIEIKSVVREQGYRAKVAVESHMEKVDSIGACIGLKGTRIRSIVQELKGEKIDVIPYDSDIKVFIGRALAPAAISSIHIFPEDNRARIIVEDNQLSLAIGKKGQNVRLAARLTEWRLDIRSKTQAEEEKKLTPEQIDKRLGEIPGVGKSIAHHLGKAGFITIGDVARAKAEDLTFIPRLGKDKAERIISEARGIVEQKEGKTS